MDDPLLETVMMELVVRSQCWQCTHPDAVRKKDLRRTIDPGRALFQLVPVDVDVVLEALHGPLKGQRPGEKDEHDEVWEESSEPDNLKLIVSKKNYLEKERRSSSSKMVLFQKCFSKSNFYNEHCKHKKIIINAIVP